MGGRVETEEFAWDHQFEDGAIGDARQSGEGDVRTSASKAGTMDDQSRSGWKVVKRHAHPIMGLDEGEQLRWRVLSKEQIGGAGESGVMQGL